MPVTFTDRVYETTTTTGTGTITLAGAGVGYVSFSAGIGTGNNCHYAIIGQTTTEWEVGIGTVATATTLSRTRVLASSNAGALVNFSAGTKDVICTGSAQICTNISGCIDVDLTAGDTIALLDFVYVSTVDGKVYRAEADSIAAGTMGWLAGFVVDGTNTATSVGYATGGLNSNTITTTTDKISYTTDVRTVVSTAALSVARYDIAGCSDGTTYGYALGGTSGVVSALPVVTVDRITYSTDVMAASANSLSQARYAAAGCSNGTTAGYVAGGNTSGGGVVTADKVTFSTGGIAALVSANLTTSRYLHAGFSNSGTAGYFAGGVTSGNSTSINKLPYSTESTASVAAVLSQARQGMGAVSKSGTAGYVAGGNTGSDVQTADKYTYSNDTCAALASANLTSARNLLGNLDNGTTNGYFAGGSSLTTTDKLAYSTETTAAATTANLTLLRQGPGSMSAPSATTLTSPTVRIAGVVSGFTGLTYGAMQYLSTTAGGITQAVPANPILVGMSVSSTEVWIDCQGEQRVMGTAGYKGFAGGGNTSATADIATSDKLTYRTDVTAAQASANLSTARTSVGCCVNQFVSGYFCGGLSTNTTTYQTTTDKITFSNDTTAVKTTANIQTPGRNPRGLSNGSTAGYVDGGNTGSGLSVTQADKIVFSTDVSSVISSIGAGQDGNVTVTDGFANGYVTGGSQGAGSNSATYKFPFATETSAAVSSADISQARQRAAGFSNGFSTGFFQGGFTGATVYVTTADQLMYATDTTSASTGAALPAAKGGGAYLSSDMGGYSIGGATASATRTNLAHKLFFYNGTCVQMASANLSSNRESPGGMSDAGV